MLGTRIAMLRRGAGLSQAQLAKRLKISASAMGMYEQGRREPSVETLVDMARVFGVSTDYLLTGAEASSPESDGLRRRLTELLSAENRRFALENDGPVTKKKLAELLAILLLEENSGLDAPV